MLQKEISEIVNVTKDNLRSPQSVTVLKVTSEILNITEGNLRDPQCYRR